MKTKEINNYLGAIEFVKNIKLSGQITLALAKNKKNLLKEAETLNEARLQLCKSHCENDEKGEPIMVEIKDDDGKVLGTKYKFSEENEKLINDEYEKMLNEDCKIELQKFSEGLLSQYKDLTVEQTEALLLFIE